MSQATDCPKPFTLRELFGHVTTICILFGTGGVGVRCFLFVGVPTALGCILLARGTKLQRRPRIAVLCLAAHAGVAFLVCHAYGSPDWNAVFMLTGFALWSGFSLLLSSKRKFAIVNAVVVGLELHLFMPWVPVIPVISYTDLRQGMHGNGVGFGTFSKPGVNTRVIRETLGDREPNWLISTSWTPGALGYYNSLCAGEIVTFSELTEFVDSLECRADRRRILDCLTDTDNLLRRHQAAFVAMMHTFGSPSYLREEWRDYRDIFFKETDPKRAARRVHGWFVEFQEMLETVESSNRYVPEERKYDLGFAKVIVDRMQRNDLSYKSQALPTANLRRLKLKTIPRWW